MLMRIAIVLFVIAVILMAWPFVTSAVRRAKKGYDKMADKAEDTNCRHRYYPKYAPDPNDREGDDNNGDVIGKECIFCEYFVPLEDMVKWELQPVIDSGWAVVRENGVYAIGSEKQFAWYRQRVDAGKKRAEAPRDEFCQFAKEEPAKLDSVPADTSESPAEHQRNSIPHQPLTPTLTPSPSLTLTQEEKTKKNTIAISSKTPKSKDEDSPGGKTLQSLSPITEVWRSYKRAYEEKHGTGSATWNKKVGGMLKQFVQRVPQDEAPDIAEFFVSHNSSFYVQSGHPIGLLLKDAEKLRTEWLTGRKMTTTRARQLESRDANVEAVQSYLDEKIAGGHS